MARKGTSRSQQHDWKPIQEDESKVYCTKCEIIVQVNDARRGIGPCDGHGPPVNPETGEVQTQELSPEDIRARLPKARPFVASGEDHGKCNGCGRNLQEMPFNSRLAMVACNTRACTLYRQRLRFIIRK